MYSRFLGLIGSLAVGGTLAYFSLSDHTDPESIAKAVIIGLCSTYILFLGVQSGAEISEASDTLERLEGDLAKKTQGLPSLVELEAAIRRRGSDFSTSLPVLRRTIEEIDSSADRARWVASAAVYIGLAGTLIGLTIAVIGLKGLGSEVDGIKSQILTVVSGFGGSFACALCGIVVTLFVSSRLGKLDQKLSYVEVELERHISEVLLPASVPSEVVLSKMVAEIVSNSINTRLEELFAPVKTIILGLGKATSAMAAATTELRKQSEGTSEAVGLLQSAAHDIAITSDRVERSSKPLLEAFGKLQPVLEKILTGAHGIDATLSKLEPALKAFTDLREITRSAEQTLANVEGQVAGIAAGVRDSAMRAAGDNSKQIAKQQDKLVEQLSPVLTGLTEAIKSLEFVCGRVDDLVRNLPVASAATRILDDMHATGFSTLDAAKRDAETAQRAARNLAKTEENIAAAIRDVRTAHAEMESTLLRLKQQTGEVKADMNEITEYLSQGFWKRLAGRKV